MTYSIGLVQTSEGVTYWRVSHALSAEIVRLCSLPSVEVAAAKRIAATVVNFILTILRKKREDAFNITLIL